MYSERYSLRGRQAHGRRRARRRASAWKALFLQSFQMISDQLRVFLSPQARTSSPSLARGTKSIVCIHVEFLPAGFASYGSWGL